MAQRGVIHKYGGDEIIVTRPLARRAHGRRRISSARRKPTIFDAVSRLVPPPRHVATPELLASDALTLASRHSVTACEGFL